MLRTHCKAPFPSQKPSLGATIPLSLVNVTMVTPPHAIGISLPNLNFWIRKWVLKWVLNMTSTTCAQAVVELWTGWVQKGVFIRSSFLISSTVFINTVVINCLYKLFTQFLLAPQLVLQSVKTTLYTLSTRLTKETTIYKYILGELV